MPPWKRVQQDNMISSYPVFFLPGLYLNFIFDIMDSYDMFLANLDQESW